MNKCSVNGTVVELFDKKMKIRIKPEASCAVCAARMLCSSSKDKVITLDRVEGISSGDRVSVAMNSNAMLGVVFLLYIAGMLVAAAVSFVLSKLASLKEVYSALVFLAVTIIYIPIISRVLSKRFAGSIKYSIKKLEN